LLPATAAWLVEALDTVDVEGDDTADEVVATAAGVALAAVLAVVAVVVPVWVDVLAVVAVWVTPAMIPAVATPPATTTPMPAARARRTSGGVLVMHPASRRSLSGPCRRPVRFV
jgi:hypothetical protein